MIERRAAMLNVVCVKQGSLYGPEYVNNLYAMVARNLDVGTEGRFICFTDDETGLGAGIQTHPLPRYVHGWWSKLYLFAPGVFDRGDKVLYLDLDTVIVGDLDTIGSHEPPEGRLLILRDYYRPEGLQASAMMWRAGFGAEIWQSWNREGRPEADGESDQNWIERVVKDPIILHDLFPGSFVSYKVHCQPFPPEDAVVVDFHGEPKPHNCGRSWVDAMWTDSDTGHFHLNMVGNVDLDTIRKQMRFSAGLGLPGLKSKPAHDRKVAIVGGGPSVGDPLSLASLSNHRAAGGRVWALNGSYDWLLEHGVVADAHVVIDARLENCGFLDFTHAETMYYIASQCHWAVFDKLRRRDRQVVRLDLETMGDCGTTVGTHAILTAFVEGYREIHLYGFDSSYRGDEGHAYDQAVNGDERVVDAHIEDTVYRAAPWMVRQVQDFEGISRDVVAAGGCIVVHGDGLLPHMARMLASAPPPEAVVRAQEVLSRLPAGPVRGAEVGVFCGEMSAALLEREDLSLLMVDSWEGRGAAYMAESGDWHARLSQADQDAFCERARAAVAFSRGRAEIVRQQSVLAAVDVAPRSLDFVFLDADHSYVGCAADIEAWLPTLKSGGLLCGHDYDSPGFPGFGVKRAVDEFSELYGFAVERGKNLTWFVNLERIVTGAIRAA